MLALSLLLYAKTGASWGRFALLFLAPDLSMLGYLAGARLGAAAYNLVHTYFGPLLFIGCAVLAGKVGLLSYGLIWIGHIGVDRLLGFGLKYPARFNDTHLQHV